MIFSEWVKSPEIPFCYGTVELTMNFNHAEEACIYLGGHLSSMDGWDAENEWIANWLKIKHGVHAFLVIAFCTQI